MAAVVMGRGEVPGEMLDVIEREPEGIEVGPLVRSGLRKPRECLAQTLDPGAAERAVTIEDKEPVPGGFRQLGPRHEVDVTPGVRTQFMQRSGFHARIRRYTMHPCKSPAWAQESAAHVSAV